MKHRYALLSVTDKTGLPAFAKALVKHGYVLLSTGGTAKCLREAGLEVQDLSDFTGLPEMFDGRVKTLHPKVFAGILARPNGEDASQLRKLGWDEIDMVVVNLYQFRETVAKPGVTLEEAVEKIDIGGPSLLRAAAKNFTRVTVVCDPRDYEVVAAALDQGRGVSPQMRFMLAGKVFSLTAMYDAAIADYLPRQNLN